jgi:F-type H+-transporting ATPase subunit delta
VAERSTIARPYAKAAFALARTSGRLAQWSQGLEVAAAVSADARVRPLFGNPHVAPQRLVEFIGAVGGTAIEADVRRMLAVLADNGRLGFLPEIAQLYGRMRADFERVLDVTLSAAVQPTREQLARFSAALSRRFARAVRLHTRIDTNLMGGAVLQADDLVIDGSVQLGLSQLAARLAG